MNKQVKIAIPLWEKEVAPRFGCTDQYLVAVIERQKVKKEEHLSVSENLNLHSRLKFLNEQGVDILLCSGFDSRFIPLAISLGIEVRSGLSGPVNEVVPAFCERKI